MRTLVEFFVLRLSWPHTMARVGWSVGLRLGMPTKVLHDGLIASADYELESILVDTTRRRGV